MQQAQLETLRAFGVDVEATIARFGGNEALLMRFLTGFSNDKTMQSLRDAVAAGDLEAMKVAAHSLKGLTGNLGLTPLFNASSELMNALRQGETNTDALYQRVCAEYDNTLIMLAALA